MRDVLRSRFLHLPILVALLLMPASAAAEVAPGNFMQFQLPASNGYTFQLWTQGSQAAISLWGGDHRFHTTYYVADAVDGYRIEADLGDAGRIDVQFKPSGEQVVVPPARLTRAPKGCRQQITQALGTFTGTIELSGEGGNAAVTASQAAGSAGPPTKVNCSGWIKANNRPLPELRRKVEPVWVVPDAILMSTSRSSDQAGSSIRFLVSRRGAHTEASAQKIERLAPDLVVSRSVGVPCPPSTFSYPHGLNGAVIRPPAPFSGEARYLAQSRRFVGDLAVDFPGLPRQRLSGPGFQAQIRPLR